MLIIRCPWCGERAEIEFSCGGEADIARPLDSEALDDTDWGNYLFMRDNHKGPVREQWHHSFGCRRWFVAERDNVTYRITRTEPVGMRGETAGMDAAGTQTPGTQTRGTQTSGTQTTGTETAA